jgi:hypothetical protein
MSWIVVRSQTTGLDVMDRGSITGYGLGRHGSWFDHRLRASTSWIVVRSQTTGLDVMDRGSITGYGLGRHGSWFDHRQGRIILLLSKPSRPALWATRPPVQSVPADLPAGVKQPERETVSQLHLVPRLRMSGAVSPLPPHAFMACTWTTLSSV